jgi:hypothetical protein
MVNDMQAASEASDKLKLQNALEAAVAAPPYIRMPPFAIAHFTRLRKHLVRLVLGMGVSRERRGCG